jgi:hypothetical protein
MPVRPFELRRGAVNKYWEKDFLATQGYSLSLQGVVYGAFARGGFASTDLIESFPYAVEWMLRNLLAKTDDHIDMSSFDQGHTDLSGWKIAGTILEQAPIEDHLNNILAQCKSRLFRDENGKYYYSAYNSAATVDYTDFKFEKDSNITNIKIERTPLGNVFNTVRVRYARNYSSGDYQKETFIECKKLYSGSRTTSSLTAAQTTVPVDDGTDFNASPGDRSIIMIEDEVMTISSIASNTLTVTRGTKGSTAVSHATQKRVFILQTNSDDGTGTQDQNTTAPNDREDDSIAGIYKYHQNKELAIDADMIKDDLTAQNLREHLFDYYSRPHYIVEFDSTLKVCNLKIANIIEFDDSAMDTFLKLGGESWASKKFEVINIRRRGVMDYTIRAVEL